LGYANDSKGLLVLRRDRRLLAFMIELSTNTGRRKTYVGFSVLPLTVGTLLIQERVTAP
jgi:hypothetical protein